MHHERLITGVAGVFAAIAVVLTVVAVAGTPVALPVALAFAAAAVLMYDQLSGRMAARVYRRVEERARVDGGSGRRERGHRRRRPGRTDGAGGFGAGPRDRWEPPRGGRSAREAAAGRRRTAPAGSRRATATGHIDRGPAAADRAAYDTLGVEPGADQATVRAAYRDLVKETHPDVPDGNEERFKAITAAYERLTE